MKVRKEHDQKAVQISVSVPRYINEVLKQQQNASAVITHLLEENFDRIGDGRIEQLLRNREREIKDITRPILKEALEEAMEEVFEKFSLGVKKEK